MDNIGIKNNIINILDRLFADAGINNDILEYVDLTNDLGMDSINFISLIIELETKFGVQIPDDLLLIDNFNNYSLIYSVIEELLNRKETEGSNVE